MENGKWVDSQPYSDGETTFSAIRFGKFRVTLQRRGVCYNHWYASCSPVLFTEEKMASGDLAEAKCQAIARLQVTIEEALDLLVTTQRLRGR